MSNKKNYKRKGNIDQGSYSQHPHVKRVAIGKAVINVKKVEDQINYNVFKCGMHAIDLFKVHIFKLIFFLLGLVNLILLQMNIFNIIL